ncbi:MAG: hypothetical protein KIT18_05605 [Burkholderiales bacterium]|nr:hypothetical protein [Burkholderiales bacterium]
MSRYRIPPDWADYGARWGNDGLLYLAEWRRGFTVHEFRALFFESQQVRSLKTERDTAQRDLEAATAKIEALERRVYWYRRQLIREARLYPLFQRPNG